MNLDKINVALEKFTNRFDTINTMILQDIGRYIKKFEGLIPSQAYKVAHQLKYGQSIEKIEAELKKASNLTSSEIHELLEQTAKDNIAFANTYYQYRNLSPVNYEENEVFQELVSAAEEVGKKSVENLSKTTAFKLIDDKGEPLYLDIEDTYNEVIDRCALAITSGELDYNTAINNTIKQLAASGIKKVYYDNDNKRAYMRRLDSSVRMNVLEAVSQLNMKMQEQFAKDFGADGVEISAHTPCAPDHQDIQGKQYSQEEFQVLNDSLKRKIGTLNCTHYAFSIVLGVNQPQYSDEELKQMKKDSNKKISFQGKEYTKYQATQVQRQLETKLRYLRDEKNILKIAGSNEDKTLINKKISQTTALYKDFSDSAGLETRMERTRSYVNSKNNGIGKQSELFYQDVTEEYLKNATPNSHKIEIDDFFIDDNGIRHPIEEKETMEMQSKKSNEYRRAKWLKKILGHEIHLVPRITDISNSGEGVHTPDFLWNGEKWDLKTPKDAKFENAIETFTKRSKQKLQAKSLIIDFQNYDSYSNEEIIKLVDAQFRNPHRDWIKNIMIVRNKKLIGIYSKK